MSSDSDFMTGGEATTGLKLGDLEGRLVVIVPGADEEEIETMHGAGKIRRCEVVICDGTDELAGTRQELGVFATAVLGQLGTAQRAGKMLVGVVGKGQASGGKNAPWLILDPTPEQVVAARAAYMAATVSF